MPYRQTEVFTRFLPGFVDGLQAPDVAIKGRVNGLSMDLGDSLVESNRPVSIVVDASGDKIHDRGDRIRRVWNVRMGYLKMEYTSPST